MSFPRAFFFGLATNFYCVAIVTGRTAMSAIASGFLVGALSWDRYTK